MRTTAAGRVAAVLVALEGVALLVLVGLQIAGIATGGSASLTSAIALAVLTAVAAAAVLAFAVAIWRALSWGRSGGVVTQVLILAVAIGAATGAYAHPVTGLVLAVPALAALVLLFLAARAAGRAKARGDEA